jgi:hypothetical protein
MSDLSLQSNMAAAQAEGRALVVPRMAQRGLIILLSVAYGGGFLFLTTISPLLLYGFYVALMGLIILRIESVAQLIRDIRPLHLAGACSPRPSPIRCSAR